MKNFLTGFILLSVFFVGCKNEKSVDSLEVVQPEIVDENFKVSVDVIVKKNDDFSLFYTEDGTIDFKIEPIWTGVKGSESSQIVTYNLPADVFPTQLRLDFGMNKEQEDIILKSVILQYKGNKRVIAGPELVSFFRADENKCTFDPVSGVITARVIDGVRQYPSLYPHQDNLQPAIEKLAQ